MTKETKTLKINRLPAPTYRYLKMNHAEVPEAEYKHHAVDKPELENAVLLPEADGEIFKGIKTGCGEELTSLLDSQGIPVMRIAAGKPGAKAKYDIVFAEGEEGSSRCEVDAPSGTDITVIQFIESGRSGTAALQTVLKAGNSAKIHLVQIISCGEYFRLINDVAAAEEDRAAFELTQLYLSGSEIITGTFTALDGYRSEYRNDIAYLLKDSEKLDINLVASHRGRKTQSEINAKGVLSDKAQKVFRGTIDFINGASGAKGAENEEVLMINEGVVNKTVPLILCAEEDVEGSHGASIGKLDERYVFYMMSRGMSLGRIYEMMSRAKVEAAMRRINDEETLARIEKSIGGAFSDDEQNTVG